MSDRGELGPLRDHQVQVSLTQSMAKELVLTRFYICAKFFKDDFCCGIIGGFQNFSKK